MHDQKQRQLHCFRKWHVIHTGPTLLTKEMRKKKHTKLTAKGKKTKEEKQPTDGVDYEMNFGKNAYA